MVVCVSHQGEIMRMVDRSLFLRGVGWSLDDFIRVGWGDLMVFLGVEN